MGSEKQSDPSHRVARLGKQCKRKHKAGFGFIPLQVVQMCSSCFSCAMVLIHCLCHGYVCDIDGICQDIMQIPVPLGTYIFSMA